MEKSSKSWIRTGTAATLFGGDYEDGIAIRFDANTAIADSNISVIGGNDLDDCECPSAVIQIDETTSIMLDAKDLWCVV